MLVAILTFEGFNEIDSFVALNMINRTGVRAFITSPSESVRSMNGVRVEAARPLEFANEANAVVVGSGTRSVEVSDDRELLARLRLDPERQLIGAQCSGALLLDRLGLLPQRVACTDQFTRPVLEARGLRVLERPFVRHGNVVTVGGCLSAHYLAAWIVTGLVDAATARAALGYVVPVGETTEYIERAMTVIGSAGS